MDTQAPLTVPKPASSDTTEDNLRTATPLSASSVSSIRSSSIKEAQAPDSNSLKHPPSNLLKALEISGGQEPKQAEKVNPTSTLASAPNISSVPEKGSNLMMKWLPSSTSALAEPLEQEITPRDAISHYSKHGGHNSGLLMTPPFTPIKRTELLHSTKAPQTPQFRASEQFHPRGVFMTPPSTIKHDQIQARSRTPRTGLSPALRISGRNSSRGTSPNPYKPNAPDSLVYQVNNNSSSNESHRPRSLSTPMEPNVDLNSYATLSRLFTPRSDQSVEFSSDEGSAEFRKRAGTFCSTPSGPFYPHLAEVGSPATSSLLSPHKVPNTPSNLVRSTQQPAGFGTFVKNAVLPRASSPIVVTKPGSYLNLASHRAEDPTALLFSSSKHAPDFSLNASKTNISSQPTGNAGADRHQRHHTAPAEGSPLAPSGRPQLPLGGNGNYAGRRLEERSMSITANSQAERLQNLRFRPRSSTVAETSAKILQGKGLFGTNWKGTELEIQEEAAEDEARSTTGRQTLNPLSVPVANANDYAWYNALSDPNGSALSGAFNFFSSSLSRPQNWGGSSSGILTRYCKVLGVPPKLLGSMKGIVKVRNAFEAYGDLLDIHVDTLSPIGFILVGFHDARSMLGIVQNGVKTLEKNFGSYLKMEPLSRNDVIQLTQDLDNPVLSENEGALILRFDDPRGIITEEVLTEYLSRYGDLKSLRLLGFSRWFVEWYDDRRAAEAQKELMARDFADFQVTVEVPEPDMQSPPETQYPGVISQSLASGLAPNVCLLPLTIRPPSVLNPTNQFNNSMLYRHAGDSYSGNYSFPWAQPLPVAPSSSLFNMHTPVPLPADGLANLAPISSDIFRPSIHHLDPQPSSQPSVANRPRAFPFPGVPPSNVMDLDRIECGSDPRTTCMIKNIPNKITDEMLFNFINEICPRGFDFLYLRMDFKARLNVGYAFINFLSVENVLRFAKSKLGVKWGVFLSEKTVQMCYASIQGKENLIEKFRNSAIMEEEESFRPKIYHSSGPLMGLPEPFPHANDLQRKARSQANAALLVRPTMSPINATHQ